MTSGTGMREHNKGREKKSGHDTESESTDHSNFVARTCCRCNSKASTCYIEPRAMPIACSLCTLPIVRPVVVNTCPACGDDVHSDCLNQHIRQKHARAFDVWTQGLDATPCLRRLASVAAAASEPSSPRATNKKQDIISVALWFDTLGSQITLPKKLVNRSWTRPEAEEAHK